MKFSPWKTILLGLVLTVSGNALSAEAAGEDKTPPYTHYWMSVATENMVVPGMSGDMSGAGMMGKMLGMPEFGPKRRLHLQINSPKPLPPDPQATHDIPPGQNMGKTLPLLIPPEERAEHYRETPEREREYEKPKMRMLIYWGCSETVREGQPRVIDTEKMSPQDFGKAFGGRGPSPQYPPAPRKGWIYADWPNRKSSIQVPKESSLQGDQFVHGNYSPDIKFLIDQRHDFMAPVEFTSLKGGLADSIRFQWRSIPTATGYFAQAMAHNQQTGESIFWSSSEVPDVGFGLMDYLSNSDVRQFIKEKVVMGPEITTCAIPRGIFKDTGGSALQFIGYGDEMNLIYPPKPKDPREPWIPIWSVKVRLKSTGMTTLGTEERESRRPRTKDREVPPEEDIPPKPEKPQKPEQEQPKDKTLDKIRGIFGF